MERTPQLPAVPDLNDFSTRAGIRASAQQMYNYLLAQRRKLQQLFGDTATELSYLYGEISLPTGGPTTRSINVPGAMPGFLVEATYDQDLQGVSVSSYVSAPDTVTVLMSGPAVALAPGKLRVWVYPKPLG